jgi:hypothetical protein
MIMAIADEVVVVFGGLPGVRDAALLDNSMDMPKNLFASGDNPSFSISPLYCILES